MTIREPGMSLGDILEDALTRNIAEAYSSDDADELACMSDDARRDLCEQLIG